MIRPVELDSDEGNDIWATLTAAERGDIAELRRLLNRNPRLSHAEYWYSPTIHFAARAGHVDAVRLLLDFGADPEGNGLNDRTLIEMARERGHQQVVRVLELARESRGRAVAQQADDEIHDAAARGDVDAVRALLDADPRLIEFADRLGGTPLHRAVLGGNSAVVTLLLDRGANIHAAHGATAWPGGGIAADVHAIDLAIWGGRRQRGHLDLARLLVSRGATYDLTIATALGDLDGVRGILDDDPSRIRETRPSGRRPLPTAVEFGRDDIVRLLLERGANPRWEEPAAPRGTTVHSAAARGSLEILKLLLKHGADPNEEIDSTSAAVAFAATPEIRALLEPLTTSSPYEPNWVDDDDQLARVAAGPQDPYFLGCAFTMSAENPAALARLHGAGLRMPDVHTSCQGYLVRPDALRALLAHGMNPDQMNWQHQTLLHHASTKDTTECAAILLDAGATITARDDEYRSTPLGWAARTNKPKMVELLLWRGAPLGLPDDEPWATPLAWATRRGHTQVVELLRAAETTA